MGVAMVPNERDYPVNARISSAAANRLKKLALRRGQSYGEILDGLIMGVPLPAVEWETPLNDALSRIAELETQVSALLSSATIADTATLPTGAAVDQIEKEASLATPPADFPDISESKPVAERAKPSVKEFIGNQVAAGERSPSGIARALNQAGYRTGTRSEFTRGNPQIKAALDQVKGE